MDLIFDYERLWWLESGQILECLVNSKRPFFFLPS